MQQNFYNLASLARALGGEISNGEVLCPGPGHSAADRSLSVKPDPSAPDGILYHSFAGDDPIVCRDYLRAKGVLPEFKANGGNGRSRATSAEIEAMFRGAVDAERGEKKKFTVVAKYSYEDENGALLYQVLRLDPKSFRQRRPDKNGKDGWSWKLRETDKDGNVRDLVRRVVYRLPDLLKHPDATVFVCEGEKDADRVASLSHCATTISGGSRWDKLDLGVFAGRDVVVLQDADEPGHAKALAAATALHEVAATIRIVVLPGLTGHPNNKDVSDWLDADPKRAEEFVEDCFDVPVWTPEAAAEAIGSPPVEKSDSPIGADTPVVETEAPTEKVPLPFLDLVRLHGVEVPEREWCVLNRIPRSNVTLLSGEGSVGKTILALQLAVATVLGRDWIGTMPEIGPVLALCCEDDKDELHRRVDAIVKHYGATVAELGDLHLLSLAGDDALMAAPNRTGLMVPTKLFARVTEAAIDIKPKLIVLDNSADVFGGNENDRAQVRQFIGMLRGLAISSGSGVLLTSHPSLTGIASGTGLSGSTAWNASVRSRLYFKRATTEKGEELDPDLRVLEVMKANYARSGEIVTLRWNAGLFLPEANLGTLDKLAAEKAAEDLFLRLLDKFHNQGRTPRTTRPPTGMHPLCSPRTRRPAETRNARKVLTAAMERLFASGRIKVENYGRPSRPNHKLARV